MHPLDIDTTPHWQNVVQHWPYVGAAVAAAQQSSTARLEVWHLIVSMVALAVTLGSIIYYQVRQQANLESTVALIQRDVVELRATDAFVRRRQEINEERIGKLETSSALVNEFEGRMIREHADIYQAIRKSR